MELSRDYAKLSLAGRGEDNVGWLRTGLFAGGGDRKVMHGLLRVRHAFAVAMVAWYLMIPPIDASNKVDANAPLATWRKGVKFDSQDECQQSLKDVIQHPTTAAEYQAAAKATKKANMMPLTRAEMTKRMAESQCVAADDPRIRAKSK